MTRSLPGWLLPAVFAHRCGGALAPENSLAGLRLAARLGLQAVEFDVALSRDGSPWLLHDATLERTSSASGLLAQASDEQLRRVDVGCKWHAAFVGEPLPDLAAAASLCRRLGLRANVEIKPVAGNDELAGTVTAACVRELWPQGELPLVSSFSQRALLAARRAVPHLPLACLFEQVPADWRQRLDQVGAFSLHCAAAHLRDDVLREAAAAGVPVLCYTVNGWQDAERLWRRGVAAIFTDRLDYFAADDACGSLPAAVAGGGRS